MINSSSMRRCGVVLVLLFVAGAGLRAIDLWKPVDGGVRESWRECDGAGIARNFVREGMNPLYPRVDWRGDGPGYAEMELPLLPWLTAVCYKLLGYHEEIGRVWAYLFSLVAFLVFMRLAQHLLPPTGAYLAGAFFALSPLAIRLSNALQPDGLMLTFYLAAMYWFLKWIDDNSWSSYTISLGATALAILLKASAAHIGFVFLGLLLWRRGPGVFRELRVWAFGVGSLLPGALWYAHARGLWLEYGNSLGISSEVHLIGWDIFTDPGYVTGLVFLEVSYVWMPAGLVAAAIVVARRFSDPTVRFVLLWVGALILYYLVVIRTSSASWAAYYHVVSVPVASLLVGASAQVLGQRLWRIAAWRVLAVASVAWVLVGVLPFERKLVLGYSVRELLAAAAVVVALSILALPLFNKAALVNSLWMVTLAALPGVFLLEARQVVKDARPDYMKPAYECALEMAPAIPEGVLIVASGGPCTFGPGLRADYNASYMFFWTDRKGFNICEQEQSIQTLQGFARRGARYFIAEKRLVRKVFGFEDELTENYSIVRECPDWYLFALGEP